MHERRRTLQAGVDLPTLLRESSPDLFKKLAGEFGEELVHDVERQITISQIDRCWSDHLANVAEIREGIHLMSMGGLNAFDEFNRQINAAFREVSRRIDAEVVATFETVRITADGIDLEKEGLTGPSSTWTYMINDNPMGDIFERLLRGIRRIVKGEG
jgi:preprotein translocase subunit SecA